MKINELKHLFDKKEHGCECGCDHCHHEEEAEESNLSLILLGVSALLVVISLFGINNVLRIIIQIIAVILAAYPIAFSVYNNVRDFKNFSFSEIELMFISIVAACCLGQLREAAAVGILYRVGEMLEEKALEQSRRNIDEVSKIQQDFANVILSDGTVKKVHAEEVKIGTRIRVLPYERFPIDGVIYEGESTVDASAVTGESMPIDVGRGTEIKSGMLNGSGSVSMVTIQTFGESTASRIVKMVEEAAEKKGKAQKAITKFAKIYTPVVVALAVLIAIIPSIITKDPADWISRALVFLVASCPCALVISIPLGFYSGLGAAAKKGILVKGSVFAENFAQAQAVAFDKTGTLTTGVFEIETVHPIGECSEDMVLTLAAAAEHFSSHPIAKSIVSVGPELNEELLLDFKEYAGSGASVTLAGKKILCGSKKLLAENGIDGSYLPDGDICVALDKKIVGTITMRTKLRRGAAKMIEDLKAQGIKRAVMLTGDSEVAAKSVSEKCNLDECYCNLLPGEKLQKLEEIRSRYGKTVYIGDGINDAPVLAEADAGIAMGLGTQAASEAADIILTNDDLTNVAPAHRLFRQTVGTMKFNIIFSLAIKAVVLLLGILGIAPVWLAVFADVGVCIICVIVSSLIGKNTKFLKFLNGFAK